MCDEHDFDNAHRGSAISTKGMTQVTLWINTHVWEDISRRARRNGRGSQTEVNSILLFDMEYRKQQARIVQAVSAPKEIPSLWKRLIRGATK